MRKTSLVLTYLLFLGLCKPSCQNGGQCIGTQCQCTEMYDGKSCEKGSFLQHSELFSGFVTYSKSLLLCEFPF